MSGLSLRDRLRSLVIHKGLRIEPLFLHIKRSQWLAILIRMPPVPQQNETPGMAQDMLEGLCLLSGLGIPPEELYNVAREREVRVSLLMLLPLKPISDKQLVQ